MIQPKFCVTQILLYIKKKKKKGFKMNNVVVRIDVQKSLLSDLIYEIILL